MAELRRQVAIAPLLIDILLLVGPSVLSLDSTRCDLLKLLDGEAVEERGGLLKAEVLRLED